MRRYVNIIAESTSAIVGPYKMIGIQDGLVTVEGHDPIQLAPEVTDTLRPASAGRERLSHQPI
jgi:hypothetical protein